MNKVNVPFVDLKAQYQSIKADIDEAIRQVIETTAFIRGPFVQKFEQEFAELYGIKHCVSVANGTDALYIVFKMLGIGAGDEVITVANSWISSSETIGQTGATPVFVDVDEYFTIDVAQIESKITSRTKAILPVHLYGQMADMDALEDLCQRYKLHLIEDCAQSHFSAYKGKRAGTFGLAATISFYPGKNLGAYGDAGAILTNDDALAEKCRMYANHGALKKHHHLIQGINSRLDGLQAAILSAKLPYILDWTKLRQQKAAYYHKVLEGIPQIILPQVRPYTEHTWHLYVILAEQRDELAEYLHNQGIETAIHYPVPLPFMLAYAHLGAIASDFPAVAQNQSRILSLPIYPELSNAQMDAVAKSIRHFYGA
jgi:dTDP-4-amino-4,6-dideoxygalactose transaminase